ncbi:MAG TPA: lipopolysaccharide biosynthesis protein [Sphingomicrobium sp.]|nr:lipopolysaccharide biosynthesis protein [Sphingomicrobium sp.]
MAKNVGWVVGSRGFNGVLSIVYLALAARALGPSAFGVFALILTFAQLIANFVQFQSWKGLIRYGAIHLSSGRTDRLNRLFGLTATLDIGSAIVGAVIAIVCAPLAGGLFHWTDVEQTSAGIFAGILLLTTGATPSAMLRLFNRFGVAAFSEAVAPVVRLIGSVIAYATGAGVMTFLAIWAIAAIAQALTEWTAAIIVNRSGLALGWRAFRQALDENERVLPYMLQINVSNSVRMSWTQLGTLAVGAVAGPAEAGAFRLARRLAKGMVKPVQPIALALYPELSRLVAEDDHKQLRIVVARVTLVASGLALLVVLVTGIAGREMLHLLAGRKFEFAQEFLFLLAIATAIDLAGFAFDPLVSAHGGSGKVLRTNIVAAVGYGVLLALLLPSIGSIGAAIAAIICSLLIFVQLAYFTVQILQKKPESRPAPDAHLTGG